MKSPTLTFTDGAACGVSVN